MPDQIVQFEGTEHHFPDDFTADDIARALKAAHPRQQAQPGYFEQTALFHPKEVAASLIPQASGFPGATGHPLDALRGWIQQNQEIGQKALDAFKSGDYVEGLRHGASYLANMVPGVGQRLDTAGNQLQAGDVGGGAETTASLATDLVGPAKLPAIAEAAPAVGAGLKAGVPPVLGGAVKVGGGAAIATAAKQLPVGAQIVADLSGAYPMIRSGMRQIGRGAREGMQAYREASAPAPLDTSLPTEGTAPTAAAAAAADIPATVSDVEAFLKLPPAIQDAIRKGAAARSAATPAAAEPRSPEYYGVQPAVHPSPEVRATPSTPPPTGPQPSAEELLALPRTTLTNKLTNKPSEAIVSAAYHPETRQLIVEHPNESVHALQNIPPEKWAGLQAAPSPGGYYNREIKSGPEVHSIRLKEAPASAQAQPPLSQQLAESNDYIGLRQAVHDYKMGDPKLTHEAAVKQATLINNFLRSQRGLPPYSQAVVNKVMEEGR